MFFKRLLFGASCLQLAMLAAAQVDCTDLDNFGALCNVEQGCGCSAGACRLLWVDSGVATATACGTSSVPNGCPSFADSCLPRTEDVDGGCATGGVAGFCHDMLNGELECLSSLILGAIAVPSDGEDCLRDGCTCQRGVCFDDNIGDVCVLDNDSDDGGGTVTGDPHMQGLRGQKIDWHGVDGGWYSLIKDDVAHLNINVRLTAPLPDEFPDRQLITSLAVLSEGHSLVIEVESPYTTDTDGCPEGVSPCVANGGLRVFVDDQDADDLLRFSRRMHVADGAIAVSASNLPVECRQFGGDKIWARMYQEMLEGTRELVNDESLEDWILSSELMAAPDWCAKYIAENNLADVQSTHAIFKIETPAVTVRLNAGVNFQGDGEVDWDGRVLPDLEFWQMDVGMYGLDVENPALSGILGETARPMHDENGNEVMVGFEAFRGVVEDYRVSGALGVHFPLFDEKEKE